MKSDCGKWKDELLDGALTGIPSSELREHLSLCAYCMQQWTELCGKRERMDALLPLQMQDAEPSPGFGARVVAASETRQKERRRMWQFAGAAAVVIVAIGLGMGLQERPRTRRPADENSAAQKLADWRAPTDVLLDAPEQDMLKVTPQLGDSYVHLPANKDWEE